GGVAAAVNVTSAQITSLPVNGRRVDSKSKMKKDSGTGSGSGTGTGYGSGSGSGRAAAPPPAARPKVSYGIMAAIATTDGDPPLPPQPTTPDSIRIQNLKQKVHAWVYALVDRLERKTAAGPNESRFVRDGRAE